MYPHTHTHTHTHTHMYTYIHIYTDEHLGILQEEEEEAYVLDVRAEDVDRGHSWSSSVQAGPLQ